MSTDDCEVDVRSGACGLGGALLGAAGVGALAVGAVLLAIGIPLTIVGGKSVPVVNKGRNRDPVLQVSPSGAVVAF